MWATRKEIGEIRDRLAGVRSDLVAATAARDQFADRADDLERALGEARDAGSSDNSAPFPWLAVAGAVTVLALILGIVGVRRREHGAPIVADPAPR